MGKYIAVDGMTLSFDNPAHSGNISILGLPSLKMKCDGKGVYKDLLAISISNGTDGSITNATGAGVINASAIKVKSEGQFVLRVDDKNNIPIVMTGTNPSPPPPTSTYTTVVKITDAGQTKVKGV